MKQKEPPLPDFDAMSSKQRVRALDALWDSMERYAERDRTPAWHGKILREREAEYRAGKAKPIDWETAKMMLREKKS